MVHFPWKPNEIHKTLLVKNNGIAATVARQKKLRRSMIRQCDESRKP